MKYRLITTVFLLSIVLAARVNAQERHERLLIPIGGGDQIAGFLAAAADHAGQGPVKILVLPFAYASDPENITKSERNAMLKLAKIHRLEIERSCLQYVNPSIVCEVLLAPIFVHSDAEDPRVLEYFPSDLTAIYIPEGNQQAIAVQIIKDTSLESALEEAYRKGVIVAGNGVGMTLLSQIMISGYNPNFEAADGMLFGAVEVRPGASFGVKNVILEQQVMKENLIGRLLNAIVLPNNPHLGVGVDAETGFYLPDEKRVENIFGLSSVIILDAETYHSADAVEYHPPRYLISLRNILIHVLSPGESSYDITAHQHSRHEPVSFVERDFESIKLPDSAGPLILSGDLVQSIDKNSILRRFVNLSGGENANILAIATGYSSRSLAQKALEEYQDSINISIQTMILPQNPPITLEIPQEISGIILIGGDEKLIQPEILKPIKLAWLSGTPLLTDGAATAIVGAYYSTFDQETDMESGTTAQPILKQGNDDILPGLALLDITIASNIMGGNRWGNLLSLAYHHPKLIALGLNNHAVLEILIDGALVSGENVVFTLDLRTATVGLGTNQGGEFANGFLDVFAPGDFIRPRNADMSAAPLRAATPNLTTPTLTSSATSTPPPINTQTPTPLPTRTNAPPPTHTSRPTITPPAVPPPADPRHANMMILFAILAVMVVLIGVWINQRRFN